MGRDVTGSNRYPTDPFQATDPDPDAALPTMLLVAELFMGFLALTCGSLLAFNGLGIPRSTLDRSPFDSFLVPGLVLAGVVGGSMLLAARLTWFRHPMAPMVSLLAGGILLGWILVEAVMIQDGRSLQIAVAIYAVVVIRLASGLLRRQLAEEAGTGEVKRLP